MIKKILKIFNDDIEKIQNEIIEDVDNKLMKEYQRAVKNGLKTK